MIPMFFYVTFYVTFCVTTKKKVTTIFLRKLQIKESYT
nr:MAG TPA: hypothetical protein [Caudoviricetes sp.]